ncbi:helix-turn-helix domain-containing protein [Streptomyces sp. NPDC017405]|uniref:helix-turn-helix domain-containing protein n=1 Tax=unclassified Streptomyces TaxID=2593676 RepID=UPI00379FBC98
MVKALDKVASNGGAILADPPKQKYQFYSGNHTSVDQAIQANLWRFGLTGMARNLLDHMSTEHDMDGQLRTTQKQLADHFGCSQPKVSKALGELFTHHFAWKVRRGVLQVNPTFTYRWGSKKHRSLMTKLGAKTLREHTIVIPEPGRPS